ncbi:MAG: hypothetical protein IJQ81_05445 [Oscillibacter sp.]|nr:hypothetical protein [Oscillibacter sp.]
MTTEEAVARLREVGMRTSRETLREGLAQRVFPFGDCVLTDKSPVCYIYRALLEKWIAERFGPEDAKGVEDNGSENDGDGIH